MPLIAQALLNVRPRSQDNIKFIVDDTTGTISATGTVTIKTTILAALGMSELSLVSESASDHAQVEVSPGGPGGSNLEVALMLDVTGSMCDDGVGPCANGTKINGLKDAARELVNMVVNPSTTGHVSRVALVPFATKVRVGPDGGGAPLMKTLTNMDATWSGLFNECMASTGGGGSETAGDWTCTAYADTPVTNWKIMPCVTERYRDGAFDVSDVAPGPGMWLNGHDGSRRQLSEDSSDTPLASGRASPATRPIIGTSDRTVIAATLPKATTSCRCLPIRPLCWRVSTTCRAMAALLERLGPVGPGTCCRRNGRPYGTPVAPPGSAIRT